MNDSVYFSLRKVPGTGLPAPASAHAGQVWSFYRALDRSQRLSPDEVERLQLAKARLLLKHCVQHVPYYRRLLAGAGIVPEDLRTMEDFRRIPLLPRRTYQERFAEFRALALPPGTVPACRASTSGTSGVPVEVLLTSVSQLWWRALYLRDLEWCGIDPRGVLAAIRTAPGGMDEEGQKQFGEGLALPCWVPELQGLIESGPSHGMSILQDPRRQLAWLRRVAPDYLLSYPSNLDFLAGLIREEGQALPSLKAIQAIAGTLTEDVRKRVESAFGVPVKNVYSCSEGGYLASPCPEGHGLHVHAENVLLEVLDAEDRPCLPGQTGRVVLTTLHNYLAPFLRYDIMDEATVGHAPCPCGRGLPLLANVQGKSRPLFRLAGGRVKNSYAVAEQLHHLGGVHQHQVVQRAVDRFLVRVVPSRDWTAEHPGRIRRLIRDHVDGPVEVDVEVHEHLELPPGGKLLDTVSELETPPGVAESAGRVASGEPVRVSARNSTQSPTRTPGAPATRLAPTVLLAWELGGGFGHVQRLLPVARALASHGYRPVLVCKNLVEPWPALRDAPFPILQAPLWHPRPWRGAKPFQAVSYADILAVHGYAAVEDLLPMVQGWQGLLDVVQPALVVCDHSPTLCLAAYGAVPTIVLGNGFTVPPVEEPTFPLLLPGRIPLVPEAELLAVVREVQRRRRRPAPDTLPGLLAGAERFMTVLPEMDPYQAFRHDLPLGPLEPLAPLAPPPARPTFFAYLSAEAPGLEQILGGLARSGVPGGVYLRGASPEMRQRLQKPGLEILDAPRPLAEVLPRVSAVVHHAGPGLAQHALSAGRPQLVFPSQLEQLLNAQLLRCLGVGQYFTGALAEDVIARALRQVVGSRPLAEQALARAADIQRRGPWEPLPRLVEHCLVLLEQQSLSSNPVEVSHS